MAGLGAVFLAAAIDAYREGERSLRDGWGWEAAVSALGLWVLPLLFGTWALVSAAYVAYRMTKIGAELVTTGALAQEEENREADAPLDPAAARRFRKRWRHWARYVTERDVAERMPYLVIFVPWMILTAVVAVWFAERRA
jgi:hypothetical protein